VHRAATEVDSTRDMLTFASQIQQVCQAGERQRRIIDASDTSAKVASISHCSCWRGFWLRSGVLLIREFRVNTHRLGGGDMGSGKGSRR
jgi:hypothetical protein